MITRMVPNDTLRCITDPNYECDDCKRTKAIDAAIKAMDWDRVNELVKEATV